MKKIKAKDELEKGELTCSYTNPLGMNLNDCEDMPVTYCKKCKRFYVLDREGNREEISIQEAEQYSE